MNCANYLLQTYFKLPKIAERENESLFGDFYHAIVTGGYGLNLIGLTLIDGVYQTKIKKGDFDMLHVAKGRQILHIFVETKEGEIIDVNKGKKADYQIIASYTISRL